MEILHIIVVAFGNNRFLDSWVGRGGPARWPPRLPDLTFLDFFLWGNIKNDIYRRVPTQIPAVSPEVLGEVLFLDFLRYTV